MKNVTIKETTSIPQIEVTPTGNGTVIVTDTYIYKDVKIPKGFISDGATVPRILWCIYPPFYPDYLTACVVHDFLCKDKMYKKADRYLQQILWYTNVKYTTRRNIVTGVKIWHTIAYTKYNNKRVWLKLLCSWGIIWSC